MEVGDHRRRKGQVSHRYPGGDRLLKREIIGDLKVWLIIDIQMGIDTEVGAMDLNPAIIGDLRARWIIDIWVRINVG